MRRVNLAKMSAVASHALDTEAVALWERGDIAGTIAKLKQAIAFDPSNKVARGNLAYVEGRGLFKRGDYAGAIEKFKQAFSFNPTLTFAQSELAHAEGDVLFNRRDFAGAAAKYRQALKLDPSDEVIRTNLTKVEALLANDEGVALAERGDWENAAAKFRQAFTLSPTSDAIRANLIGAEGAALSKLGDWASAIRKYAEAIQFDPANEQVRRSLLEAQRWADGAMAKVAEVIAIGESTQSQEFISFRANLAQAQAERAAATRRLGNLKDAVAWYRIAHELDPSAASIRKELSQAEAELAEQQAQAYSAAGRSPGTSTAPTPPGANTHSDFFGTSPTRAPLDLGPAGSNKTAKVSSALEQLLSMSASGTGATDVVRIEERRGQAACGWDTKPCAPLGQMPGVPPVPTPLSPKASALADRLANNKLAMEDPLIRASAQRYLSLDRQITERQLEIAAIRKKIDSGEGDAQAREGMEAQKNRLENYVKMDKGVQKDLLNDIESQAAKIGITLNLGVGDFPPEGASAINSGTTGPSDGAQPGSGAQK